MEYHPLNYFDKDVTFIENEYWYYIHGSSSLDADSGWKIYISFSASEATNVFCLLLKNIISFGFHFKYIKSESKLFELNAGLLGYSQIGKCIVIYMPEISIELMDILHLTLSDSVKSFPTPPYLGQVYEGLPVFYRYGAYTKLDEKDNENRYKSESRIFPISTPPITNKCSNNLDLLLTQYVVIDVISQRGKGGVFLGIDLSKEHYSEVILKTGYQHGEENVIGNDGLSLIKNEEHFIRYISSLPIDSIKFPQLISSAKGDSSYAIVQEKIEGVNALVALHEQHINENHLDVILMGLKALHKNGVLWGDAKLSNVIFDGKNGKIGFIDFETTQFISSISNKNAPLKSFFFNSENFETPEDCELAHMLVSFLFDIDVDTQSAVSISGLLSRKYLKSVQNRAKELLFSLCKKNC